MKNAQRITVPLSGQNSNQPFVESRSRLVGFLFLLCWTLACGCSGANKKDDPSGAMASTVQKANSNKTSIQLDDVTESLGIQHTFVNGEEQDKFTLLESMGGGMATADFDRDGWLDLFFPGGGQITAQETLVPLPGSLWLSRDGKSYVDVSLASGTNVVKHYTQGAAVADYNNDGFPDLLVSGYGGLQLFINHGDGTFAETADSRGLVDPHWSTSAGFGDFDNDGFLDVYVAHYADWSWENNPECLSPTKKRDRCPPSAFNGIRHSIFMNNGDESFRDATNEIGLANGGRGLGVVCVDVNEDSKLDIYVANDTTNNYLYLNQGGGRFSEIGVASGTALDERGVSNGSMGIAVLDFDGDLKPDLWVCNYENETFALYKNDGNANFRHITSSTGIAVIGTLYVAFGTVAADFDKDGDEDIVVVNGHVLRFPQGNSVEQTPLFLSNNGQGRLARQSFHESSYFSKKWMGRGAVAFDYDRDGDLDLAMSHINQPAVVLENKTEASGNWIQVELIGTKSNRDAIGARVVFTTNKKQYLRNVIGGGSYLSQNPYVVHCAFPKDETLEKMEVTWPNGETQTLADLSINQHLQIVE